MWLEQGLKRSSTVFLGNSFREAHYLFLMQCRVNFPREKWKGLYIHCWGEGHCHGHMCGRPQTRFIRISEHNVSSLISVFRGFHSNLKGPILSQLMPLICSRSLARPRVQQFSQLCELGLSFNFSNSGPVAKGEIILVTEQLNFKLHFKTSFSFLLSLQSQNVALRQTTDVFHSLRMFLFLLSSQSHYVALRKTTNMPSFVLTYSLGMCCEPPLPFPFLAYAPKYYTPLFTQMLVKHISCSLTWYFFQELQRLRPDTEQTSLEFLSDKRLLQGQNPLLAKD